MTQNIFKKLKREAEEARDQARDAERGYRLMQGGSVPGGHFCIYDGVRKPFITPMRECNSIELRHSDTVVDIGCYVGTYSIRCARFPVKRVTAYEPTPRSFEIMQLTPLPNLENINAAIVGNNDKVARLSLSKGIGVTNSLVPSKSKPETVDIPAVNYVDAVRGASVVKVDIEGGEYAIPPEQFVQPGIRALIIDFHKVGSDWIEKSERIISEIEGAGFAVVIKPDWTNGWKQAGSWIREIETEGQYGPMMSGDECCGCGAKIDGAAKSICPECAKTWTKKHRKGFGVAELQ